VATDGPVYAVAAAAFADADSVHARTIAPGVLLTRVHDADGPWTLFVVEVDTRACAPRLEARKPAGRLSARAPTTALADGAVVTVNADFFRDPGGTPVGAHVERGTPLIGPTNWPVFGITMDGAWYSGVARLSGRAHVRNDTARVTQLNRPSIAFTAYGGTTDGLVLFTVRADTIAADSLAGRVLLRRIAGDERAGSGIVIRSEEAALVTVTAADTFAVFAYGEARGWSARRAAGDTVVWQLHVESGAGDVLAEALGAFPELLRNGQDVLGTQTVRPAFGEQRHPRTAIGWTADRRRLFIIVVDGRQPPYSDGMSLPELIWAFRRLGAADALNFDGGGSTAVVIGGTLANRPSDGAGERAVANALALAGCG
jgi:hypothetical protein